MTHSQLRRINLGLSSGTSVCVVKNHYHVLGNVTCTYLKLSRFRKYDEAVWSYATIDKSQLT